ncbi:hypothetical protein SmJEL517_g02494 [Synchytrium microbalum]|uniref:Uncharacterized protein n=1 Tax=Synchytrium microbalum TaxID=1806994 RepID=A0A507CBS0_9FUNG|nr:uncharacterized protein SmJEL517_g02494 [Synchytrium microbalum]TPX34993.1 hypothetical protein SmJEL517_g02494 [Synchytrium microbalum]
MSSNQAQVLAACIDKLGEIRISSDSLRRLSIGSLIQQINTLRAAIPNHDPRLVVFDNALLRLVELKRSMDLNPDSIMDAIGFIDPALQDMMLSDITEEIIQADIARELGVNYLSLSTATPSWPVEGIVYGENLRAMINLVVQRKECKINVIFLIDTESPHTHLTAKAFNALGITENTPSSANVMVHGFAQTVYVSTGHFEDVNVLGVAYMRAKGLKLAVDYESLLCTLRE